MRYLKIIENEFIPNIYNYFKNYSDELFDYKFYGNFYKDLSKLNKYQLVNHYKNFGKKRKEFLIIIFLKILIMNFM